jgi:hypothetical protein
MSTRPLSLIALAAFGAAVASAPAMAGWCCECAYGCAPPPQVQIWGLSPVFVVNQGPVYSGPGFYTSPTYEGETLTSDYPYVGYGGYPRYRRYGELPAAPRHFTMLHRHEAAVLYHPGFGRRAITMSIAEHAMPRAHRDFGDPRDR